MVRTRKEGSCSCDLPFFAGKLYLEMGFWYSLEPRVRSVDTTNEHRNPSFQPFRGSQQNKEGKKISYWMTVSCRRHK